jgi:hypothetical protein
MYKEHGMIHDTLAAVLIRQIPLVHVLHWHSTSQSGALQCGMPYMTGPALAHGLPGLLLHSSRRHSRLESTVRQPEAAHEHGDGAQLATWSGLHHPPPYAIRLDAFHQGTSSRTHSSR